MTGRRRVPALLAPRPSAPRLVPGLVLLVLLVAAVVVWQQRGGEDAPLEVSADFADTTGLYVGNEVELLGVPVGEVVEIEPRGTTMRVHMRLDPGVELPADAGAVILQSALVTDRYVEVGPVHTSGPALAAGDVIPAERTRSPATIDEITRSVSDLVRALDATGGGGKDIGDLLRSTADTLDGNGVRIRDALVAGRDALRTVNGRSEEITSVTRNLADLVEALARRDATIRRFAGNVARTSEVLAGQRHDLHRTLTSLAELTDLTTTFIRDNRQVLTDDVREALTVTQAVRARQRSLAEAFDTMPTLAQNLTQAYDFERGRLRVQFSTVVGPFSPVFRSELCHQLLLPPICHSLFRPDGTGALDPLLDAVQGSIPGDFP